MGMGIDEFKGSVENLARPTLFKVTFPSILDPQTEFLCKAANLPAATIGTIEVPYMGRKIKIAGDRTFADWTVSIINDKSMTIRKQLEDWGNTINDHELNVGPSIADTYKHDGFVQQLGTDGAVLAEYKLVGCWPSEIGEIELDWESNDTIETYSVTFAYDYWTRTA